MSFLNVPGEISVFAWINVEMSSACEGKGARKKMKSWHLIGRLQAYSRSKQMTFCLVVLAAFNNCFDIERTSAKTIADPTEGFPQD